MKKLSLLLSSAALLCSTTVMADAIGVYVGGQYWHVTGEGGFSSNETIETLNFDDEGQSSFYVALEHPLPLIPNARIKRTSLAISGNTQFSNAYFFNNISYTGTVANSIDVEHTDFILYYEIFDTDTVTVDIGINAKKISGEASFNEVSVGKSTLDISGTVPMLYGAAKIGLPFTGFGVFAEANFASIGDHTVSDMSGGISYEFVDNLAVDMTAVIGFRTVSMELDDLDNIYADLTFDGIFAGIELHF